MSLYAHCVLTTLAWTLNALLHSIHFSVLFLKLCSSHGRIEAGRLPGMLNCLIHLIHLLQSQTLRLKNTKVYKYGAAKTAGAPDEEDLGFKARGPRTFIDEVRRGIANGPIEKPIAGDGASH